MKLKTILISNFLLVFTLQFVFAGCPKNYDLYEINGDLKYFSCNSLLNNFLKYPLLKVSFSETQKYIQEEEADKFKELSFADFSVADKLKVLANFMAVIFLIIAPFGLFFAVKIYIKKTILKMSLNIFLFFSTFLWILILGLYFFRSNCYCF